MTCSTSLSGKNRIVLIAGILMIATTLRVTFTGAAPLLDTIRSAYSLTTAQTGLLTTLPLLAFALISPLAAPVARRFGMERSLFAALLLICAGIAIRSLPSPYLLFGGTAVIGGGIALGNVLLPGLIKRDFPHSVARLTGAYSLTMGAAAALGSAMVVPLALNGFGWQGALLMLMCFSSAGSFFMAATVAKSTTCKFEYLARLTYSGYLAFAACLAGHIVSWDQLTGLLRDYWLASGDPHQSRL
ncbi:major facilitator superfamily protein [Escherichia coli]|nr:major facilitator superfamily protein [Escherichia coli]